MADPNPYQIVTCPYNMAHQVEHYRIHVHLQKCRMQYPNSKKTTCTFDATHVVNEIEMDFHVLECRKRAMFDTLKYITEEPIKPPIKPLPPPEVPSAEENWDTEENQSYIPDPSKNNQIIRKVKGLSAAERRKARMEGVKNYRPPDSKASSSGSSCI